MPSFHAAALARLATAIFERCGAPADIAAGVAEHLVASNLAGHDSHGVLRIQQYVEMIDQHLVKPDGRMRLVERFAAGAVVDGDRGFGQVVARDAMNLAIEIARASGTGAVTVRNCCHTGRLGTYTELAAAAGLVGIVAVNAGGGGQLVAPFGGTARRISTNPISIAAPSEAGDSVVLDIATSVAPEGKVRALLQAGKRLPEGWLNDARGNPTTDPAELYADPPATLLPLGGPFGHKGFGLAFMIDILAGILTGAGYCRPGATYTGDGLLAIALDVAHFTPLEDFRRRVAELAAYVKACPTAPGVERIYVPGEIELVHRTERHRTGIPIEQGTWDRIEQICRRFGIDPTAAMKA
ncbi:MAG: Ldh family oxidoreductase [Pirellulales bacterium]